MPQTPHVGSDVMTQTVVAVGRNAPFKEIVRTWSSGRSVPCRSWRVKGESSACSPRPICCQRRSSVTATPIS
ncbi:inosine-5'-monophosphate dehydrogenase [Streptomyces sp. NL15-2K]|nr:inosine-5'-monophosphate dehydrogenase [Streptomyces sp. NL15-2K]